MAMISVASLSEAANAASIAKFLAASVALKVILF
jgi:hypothetical protein